MKVCPKKHIVDNRRQFMGQLFEAEKRKIQNHIGSSLKQQFLTLVTHFHFYCISTVVELQLSSSAKVGLVHCQHLPVKEHGGKSVAETINSTNSGNQQSIMMRTSKERYKFQVHRRTCKSSMHANCIIKKLSCNFHVIKQNNRIPKSKQLNHQPIEQRLIQTNTHKKKKKNKLLEVNVHALTNRYRFSHAC